VAGGRFNREELLPHPGEDPPAAGNLDEPGRGVAGKFGGASPDLTAGGQIEGDQATVESTDTVESFGGRWR